MKHNTQLVLAYTIGVLCGIALTVVMSLLALAVGMETAV